MQTATSPFASDPACLAAIEEIRARVPQADPLTHLPDVDPRRIPRHVAIIMDGNGRWAQERGFPRIFGHRNGAASVRAVVGEAGRCGVEVLTLYSFSMENWKRPSDEVQALMSLCVAYCDGEREAFVREGVRFRVIGRRDDLPSEVVAAIESVERATADIVGPTLCLAINYGSRAEITQAARSLAQKVARGEIEADSIDEAMLERELWTCGLPDPDLLVRTAGEMRVSNYLLWQISYAELYVSDLYWPDFQEEAFRDAIRAYAGRDRRFGGIASSR